MVRFHCPGKKAIVSNFKSIGEINIALKGRERCSTAASSSPSLKLFRSHASNKHIHWKPKMCIFWCVRASPKHLSFINNIKNKKSIFIGEIKDDFSCFKFDIQRIERRLHSVYCHEIHEPTRRNVFLWS